MRTQLLTFIGILAAMQFMLGYGITQPTTAHHLRSAHLATPQAPDSGFYIEIRLADPAHHKTLLEVSLASSNRNRALGSADLRQLPCPHGRYIFTATEESLSSVPEGVYSADLTMGGGSLPPPVRCRRPLPIVIGWARFAIEITGPAARNPPVYFKISGLRHSDGTLTGVIPESVNNTLCPGRYRFLARLYPADGHMLRIAYPFSLSSVKGVYC